MPATAAAAHKRRRQRSGKNRLAVGLVAVLAALTTPALAYADVGNSNAPLPPDITPAAEVAAMVDMRFAIEGSVPPVTAPTQTHVPGSSARELRMRRSRSHVHLHSKRQEGGDGDGDGTSKEETSSNNSSNNNNNDNKEEKEEKETSKKETSNDDDDDDSDDSKSQDDGSARPTANYVKATTNQEQEQEQDQDRDQDESSSSSSSSKTATKTKEEATASGTERAKTTADAAITATDDDSDDDGTTRTLSGGLGSVGTESLSRATSTATATATATTSRSGSTQSPLPVPFDMTPTSAFRLSDGDDTCPDFVSSLLRNETFANCYPLSMMVFSSQSFFNAKREMTSMVRVLDSTCAADVDSCSDFMAASAQNLTASENCGDEFDDGLSLVMQVYNGLLNYRTMYTATCLQDPDSDQYCYAGAVTNTTSASDSYIYYLPYNLSLSASTTPSCSWCNGRTMDVFHAASSDRDLLISETYVGAARIFDNWCDPDFVNATLPNPNETSISVRGAVLPFWSALAAAAAVMFSLL
ncbi:hypothetical protein GMORB2_5948 [Geosmithia morbida]|uniref:DUF7729 domain-containing protein n=1 Tax=Geosmithia morbida TaxID=1094350 RepID=A0A9P5D2U0_9HYPO|nr:uncharacterized protein GMORB2_5948 [Geosmithia morbida]KAF4124232.1 hypothetical protein GMORB2_5948 [Geosmithia morbida]